jgi:hypothetical protein
VPDLTTLALIALLPGTAILAAFITHRHHTRRPCPYKTALARILDAANDPLNRGLAAAIDDADTLLGGRR